MDIFRKIYFEIMDAAHPQADTFTLYVLTYPHFFNEVSDDCNDSEFCFWSTWCGEKMTKELRGDINALMEEVNNIIRRAAMEISEQFHGSNKFLQVIDTNPAFEGHRFCEAGSKEPNPGNANNYFFQLYDLDVDPDGNNYDNLPGWPNATAEGTVEGSVGEGSLPNAADCEAKINSDADMDFGEHAACRISVVIAKNEGVTLADSRYPDALSSDYGEVA
jgi:hypothetical protein